MTSTMETVAPDAVESAPSMDSVDPSHAQAGNLSTLMDACFRDRFLQEDNGLMSLQTLRYRGINFLMSLLNMTFEDVTRLYATHIPLHPDVARDLQHYCGKYEMVDTILAQDFIEQERLMKLVRYMSKNGHGNKAHALLAMDGLGGSKLNHGPNVEVKRYVANLQYGATPGRYDRGTCWKQVHACAVRKVYDELEKRQHQDKVALGVYQVMCIVLKEMAGIELPDLEMPGVLPPDVLLACVDVYKTNVDMESFESLVKMLKTKIVRVEEEGGPPRKKHKKNVPRVAAPEDLPASD